MAQKWQTISELAADTSRKVNTHRRNGAAFSLRRHDFIKPTILTISF